MMNKILGLLINNQLLPVVIKPLAPVPIAGPNINRASVDIGIGLIEHGGGLFDTWTQLAYKKPPEDLFGRIFWSAGVLGQLIISTFTFPAALGAFLLEESVQSAGMGAYILMSAKQYDLLSDYLPLYKAIINGSEVAAKTMATLNPVTGGAVIIYMQAAKLSEQAFEQVTNAKLLEQAKTDETARQKLLNSQQYGTLVIKSSPSDAEIYLDQTPLGLLTPETIKNVPAGKHFISLAKYNTKTEMYDAYTFNVTVKPAEKIEMMVRIPVGTKDDITDPNATDQETGPKLPDFITAEVRGESNYDGDTFTTTTSEKVRVLGIDAPEIGRPYADLAKEFLASKIIDHKLELRIQTHLPIDAYGRTLALVYYRDENISVSIVAAGLAKAFIAEDARYDDTRIREAERIAKERRIGIWSEIP